MTGTALVDMVGMFRLRDGEMGGVVLRDQVGGWIWEMEKTTKQLLI